LNDLKVVLRTTNKWTTGHYQINRMFLLKDIKILLRFVKKRRNYSTTIETIIE